MENRVDGCDRRMSGELEGEQKRSSDSGRKLSREVSNLRDSLSEHFMVPKRTLSGTDLDYTPKRNKRSRYSASATSAGDTASTTAGPNRAGRKMEAEGMAGVERSGTAGEGAKDAGDEAGTCNDTADPQDGEQDTRGQERGGGLEEVEIEDSSHNVSRLVGTAVSKAAEPDDDLEILEAAYGVADWAANMSGKRKRRCSWGEDDKTSRNFAMLAGMVNQQMSLVKSVIAQSKDTEERLSKVIEATSNITADQIRKEVNSLKTSLENRLTRAENQAKTNNDALITRADNMSKKVEDLERRVKEGDAEMKSSNERFRKDIDHLKDNYKALNTRVRMGNVQRKISVDLDSAEDRENRRRILVKGLYLARPGDGETDREDLMEKDKQALVEAIRERTPRVMELENLATGGGLSSHTLLDTITTAVRVGAEDLEDRPLLVSFRSERDAQLVRSEAERYKEKFRTMIRKYRDKGTAGEPKPRVLWIDAPQTKAVRSELYRLRTKMTELNDQLRKLPSDTRPPFVKINMKRMCLMQDGKSEVETLECARAHGVDLEYDSPPKREISYTEQVQRREANATSHNYSQQAMNTEAVELAHARMNERQAHVTQIPRLLGNQGTHTTTNDHNHTNNTNPDPRPYNTQPQYHSFWNTQGSGGLMSGIAWNNGRNF